MYRDAPATYAYDELTEARSLPTGCHPAEETQEGGALAALTVLTTALPALANYTWAD